MANLVDSKTYNISEFIRWQSQGELNISPKFQRNSVWNEHAKSYLIDSILKGLPIPPVFIRQTVNAKINKVFREVIDGQQRLRAILEYYNEKFVVKGAYASDEVNGKHYMELSDELKSDFLEYEIAAQVVKTPSDAVIYDMFARLNTNNMVLNKQEIRNAKYWGAFKGLIYELGRETKEYFIKQSVFSDRDFARMKDYELINSLVILILDGIKSETPKSVDEYYRKYDNEFCESGEIKAKFNSLIESIARLNDDGYEFEVFNRPRYFYTLFATINRRVYENAKPIQHDEFLQKLSLLEQEIRSDSDETNLEHIPRFKELHFIRTTNAKERNERVNLAYEYLFDD